jgi:hypothetical protein
MFPTCWKNLQTKLKYTTKVVVFRIDDCESHDQLYSYVPDVRIAVTDLAQVSGVWMSD